MVLLPRTIEAIKKETNLIKAGQLKEEDWLGHYRLIHECSISRNAEAMKLWIDHELKNSSKLQSNISIKQAAHWCSDEINEYIKDTTEFYSTTDVVGSIPENTDY